MDYKETNWIDVSVEKPKDFKNVAFILDDEGRIKRFCNFPIWHGSNEKYEDYCKRFEENSMRIEEVFQDPKILYWMPFPESKKRDKNSC
jgi:hypothetical protein